MVDLVIIYSSFFVKKWCEEGKTVINNEKGNWVCIIKEKDGRKEMEEGRKKGVDDRHKKRNK